MEKAKHSVQFEAEVDHEGKITFSKSVGDLRLAPGSKVTVTIFGGVLSKKLTAIGVTEEEIERIGNTQMEDRDHVMTFLASQGVLKRGRIHKRLVRA